MLNKQKGRFSNAEVHLDYPTIEKPFLAISLGLQPAFCPAHEIIIFYKKNIILGFVLPNPKTFLTFAGKVQYIGMKIQEVMKLQRKTLGITLQDLADMSGVIISTINGT